MDNIGFVILHYITENETMACVDSIKTHVDTECFEIVIVDNASPNYSGDRLKKKYLGISNIHVLINGFNLGFSKGINEGYRFAKNELGCEYIVVLNNDIELRSSCFYDRLKEDYKRYNASVIGPRIYTTRDYRGTQNPQWRAPSNDSERIRTFGRIKKDLDCAILLSYISLDWIFLHLKRLMGRVLKANNRIDTMYFDQEHKDVQLHGCIWCFTPEYVRNYEGIETITFMYHEETVLFRRMMLDKRTTFYDPQLKVYHVGKSATMAVASIKSKSRRIRYRRERDSVIELLNYLKG